MDKLQKHCPPSPCTHTCELAYTHTHTPLTLGFGPAIWTPCLMRSVCGTVSCPPPLPEPGAEGFFQCLGHHKGGWTSDGRQGHHLERINIDYLIHCQEPPTKIHSPCKAPLPVDIGGAWAGFSLCFANATAAVYGQPQTEPPAVTVSPVSTP